MKDTLSLAEELRALSAISGKERDEVLEAIKKEEYSAWREDERRHAEALIPGIARAMHKHAVRNHNSRTMQVLQISDAPGMRYTFPRGTSLETLDGVPLIIKEWLEAEGLQPTVGHELYHGDTQYYLFASW